jgi:long-chain acyl-CoA synthetase
MLGDKRNTVTALLAPNFKNVRDWAVKNKLDIDLRNNTALTKHPEIVRLMKSEIGRLLPDLADYEKIRKFSIIGEELTIENDALTPTLKVKKRVLMERYKDMIEAMYR